MGIWACEVVLSRVIRGAMEFSLLDTSASQSQLLLNPISQCPWSKTSCEGWGVGVVLETGLGGGAHCGSA
jgi:hypothetical protein